MVLCAEIFALQNLTVEYLSFLLGDLNSPLFLQHGANCE